MSTATLNIEKTQAAGERSEAKKTLVPQLRFQEFDGEWNIISLKSLLNELVDCEHKTAPYIDESEYLVVRTNNVKNGQLLYEDIKFTTKAGFIEWTKRSVPKYGDILFTREAPAGESCLVPINKQLCLGQRMVLLKPNEKKITGQYLSSYLQSKKANRIISNLSIGTTVTRINIADIYKINCPITTISEQQKIASFLSAVDEKIQQLSRKKELLAQYKKGVMQQLFSGKLRFKDENGEDYADWEEKKLKDITEPITKGTTPKKFEKEGVNFIKIECLDGVNVNESKCLFINPKIHLNELKRSMLKENDILFAIAGSVGKVGIVSAEILPANTNQAFAIIRLKDKRWLLFILQLLTSKSMKNYIYQNMSVGAQPNLNLEQIGSFSFQSPQIEEQQKIADFLTSIDTKIESVNQQINQTQTFKKGLLQQMFV